MAGRRKQTQAEMRYNTGSGTREYEKVLPYILAYPYEFSENDLRHWIIRSACSSTIPKVKKALLEAGWIKEVTKDYWYGQRFVFAPKLFAEGIPRFLPEAVKVMKSDNFHFDYWRSVESLKDYWKFLKTIPSLKPSRHFDYTEGEFDDLLRKYSVFADALVRCFFEPQLPEFFAFFGNPEKEVLWERTYQYLAEYILSEGAMENARGFFKLELNDKEDLEAIKWKNEVWSDWFLLFADYGKTGNAVELLGKSSQKTFYAAFLVLASLLQTKQFKEAGKAALGLHKEWGSRKVFHTPLENFLFGAALYLDRDTLSCSKRCASILKVKDINIVEAFPLSVFAKEAMEDSIDAQVFSRHGAEGTWGRFFGGLAASYFGIKMPADFSREIEEAPAPDSYWAFLLSKFKGRHPGGAGPDFSKFEGLDFFPPFIKKPEWEKEIDKLLNERKIAGKSLAKKAVDGGKEERIIYLVNTRTIDIQPVLQKRKGLGWTKGSEIPLGKFKKADIPGMEAVDIKLASQVTISSYNANVKELYGTDALSLLIGHPNVYDYTDRNLRYEIEEEPLKISVKKHDGCFTFERNTSHLEEGAFAVKKDNKIVITRINSSQASVLKALWRLEKVPEEGADKLTELLESLSTDISIQSSLLKNSKNLPKVKGSSLITFQFAPYGDTEFSVSAAVRPLEGAQLTCQAGMGQECATTVHRGQPVQVERNLEEEKKNWDELFEVLEKFQGFESRVGEWILGTEECLEMLETLREQKERAVIQWPEGAKLKVDNPPLNFSGFKIAVHRLSQWFEVDGQVTLDGKTYLKVRELLDKLRESKGRFVAIGENEYVQITDALKKRLLTLDKLAKPGADGSLKVSLFNAPVLDEFKTKGSEFTADKAFNDLIGRIEDADKLKPVVPAGLECELRPYQEEGFDWLARLAHWGAGACLADDMGLGKTIQTIALLLSRAGKGPSLVVAPTAVLYNWRDELTRFAPSLNQIIFNNENREEVMKNLGPGDIVLTTYGVLTNEIGLLGPQQWNVAVLDEAHTIKNRETKMSHAAMQLTADFRLLLTGTPLQNHLDEIWNLFQFAVPGLLGSFKQFTERFIFPIERDHDKESQRVLKQILSPFMLRRTKSEVLQELPGKTEITVKVELSEEEKALYENLREEMITNLESGVTNAIQALASLTKLRQAACSPELVDPKIKLPSSKTEAFLGLVKDLITNKHRALVFSQFTSHLALIKEALDKENIPYLYLDGSDTPAARLKLVEKFQTGNVPVFLISLKAGGTGLNLTAADYVIHLDPWWNPAIEDQASDRSYRIGQDRPVTIYRLIAEGTIEEKIVELHKTKKNLADALLEGTDIARRMGKEEILALLQSR